MSIAIYTLTSSLHDEAAVEATTQEFLGGLGIEYEMMGGDYTTYGSHSLELIYVRTGGTEGIFKGLLPLLQRVSDQPFYLLTSGKSNSLAASMEILSYLRQREIKGEILHGSKEYVSHQIGLLAQVGQARQQLKGSRLGVVGAPSDWLIASRADREAVREHLGVDLVDIPMTELLSAYDRVPTDVTDAALESLSPTSAVRASVPGATRIYHALKQVVEARNLKGLTIRCFDLLTAVHNTGCVALARLNAEGIVAGCEGDVPAALSMMVGRALTGVSGFQCNPARIDPEQGELMLAHCTIPLNLVERYELDTHFESGIGVGIRGYMPLGPVTLFKLSGDLSRCFAVHATLVSNESLPDLCRTQQVIRLEDPGLAAYFLNNPIGNHHIVLPGHHKELINRFVRTIS
ncbi:MAG: hypothetical protein II786_06455 [Muribaculaceae bacterium]|nr:hypothetical protein [Muribaculaceae bacterium]MBR3101737.1 hypothetical protein [Muribaculaceae bacterium]